MLRVPCCRNNIKSWTFATKGLQKGPRFSRVTKLQGESCHVGGREVTGRWTAPFCKKISVREVRERDKAASQSSIELYEIWLRSRRPATAVSRARSVPGVSPRVSLKRGVSEGVSHRVSKKRSSNHKRGTGTRGVLVWIRIRYASKPVLIRIRFPFWYRKCRERPLKRAPNTALRLTHVYERKLAVPPLQLFRKCPGHFFDTPRLLIQCCPMSLAGAAGQASFECQPQLLRHRAQRQRARVLERLLSCWIGAAKSRCCLQWRPRASTEDSSYTCNQFSCTNNFGGSPKNGFQKGGFGRCSPVLKLQRKSLSLQRYPGRRKLWCSIVWTPINWNEGSRQNRPFVSSR